MLGDTGIHLQWRWTNHWILWPVHRSEAFRSTIEFVPKIQRSGMRPPFNDETLENIFKNILERNIEWPPQDDDCLSPAAREAIGASTLRSIIAFGYFSSNRTYNLNLFYFVPSYLFRSAFNAGSCWASRRVPVAHSTAVWTPVLDARNIERGCSVHATAKGSHRHHLFPGS